MKVNEGEIQSLGCINETKRENTQKENKFWPDVRTQLCYTVSAMITSDVDSRSLGQFVNEKQRNER